jgi:hypothetical protein
MSDINISIPSILGLPPEGFSGIPVNALRNNAFPIARITPCTSAATFGATVFEAVPAWDKYLEILNLHGYDYSGSGDYLEIAFQAENFPSDSFSNEYSQSFLESATQVVGSVISDTAQMSGDPSKILDELQNADIANSGALIGSARNTLEKGMTNLSNNSSQAMKNIGTTMAAMASGGRIDFPMVWKNSSFTPSYSMTIRLFNPMPGSESSTQRYIIGPLAALMILSCPQSADGNTIKWPFLHRIEIPGISNVIPAFISNVAVIKGGDQQQIAWNQRLGVVDVRIDFGSLFNSLIIETNEDSMYEFGEKRPTLNNYLNAMATEKTLESIEMAPELFSSLNDSIFSSSGSMLALDATTKNISSKLTNPSSIASDVENTINQRVSQELSNISNNINWTV